MSTIATDGITVSCDGLSQMSYITSYDACKITVLEKKGVRFLICAVGEQAKIPILCDYILTDPDESPDLGSDFAAMVLVRGADPIMYNSAGCDDIGYPFSIGVGAQFSMGAMLHGATSEEALKIASVLNKDTGGLIRTYDIKTAELISSVDTSTKYSFVNSAGSEVTYGRESEKGTK